ADVQAETERQGMRYLYQPVSTSSITKADVTAFHNAVQRAASPILAHCRSGTRCYLLWGLSKVMFDNASPLAVVAEAARNGYDVPSLPPLAEKLKNEPKRKTRRPPFSAPPGSAASASSLPWSGAGRRRW